MQANADTLVVFTDDAGAEYPVALPRLGHSDRDVRTVAYRWACRQIAAGEWRPHGELRYRALRRNDAPIVVNGVAIPQGVEIGEV